MKRVLLCVVLLLTVSGLFAQYQPIDGAEDYRDLYATETLANGTGLLIDDTPFSVLYNPASLAYVQRIMLGINMLGVLDTAGSEGFGGLAANFGLSLPSRYGVFTAAIQYSNSWLTGLPYDYSARLDLAFSKELFPDLYAGAGLGAVYGSASGTFGVNIDAGFIQFLPDALVFTDVKWGFSFLDIGLPYSPQSGKSALPAYFTPAFGVAATVLDSESFDLAMGADLIFPTFQNVRFSASLKAEVLNNFIIRAGFRYDVMAAFNADIAERSLIPSFGIEYRFSTDIQDSESFLSQQGWAQNDIRLSAAAAPLVNNIWASGFGVTAALGVRDEEPPVITVEYTDTVYVSPNNDGKFDDFELPVKIEDDRYIKGYEFELVDSEGNVVRSILNKEERPDTDLFANFWERLSYAEAGVPIPESIRWDGNDNNGALVPDGEYSFRMRAIDDNDNSSMTDLYTIVVDNTAPVAEIVELSDDERIFSPNDDGNKDVFVLKHTSTNEDLWQGRVKNQLGTVVREEEWYGSLPAEFAWDGTDNQGNLVPDGVYTYSIATVDRAGNGYEADIQNIIVNTEATPISLNVDQSFFSPGTDSVVKEALISSEVPNKNGVEYYTLEIKNNQSEIVRTFNGAGLPPEIFKFDGKGDNGRILPEGEYTAHLSLRYRSGNNPTADSTVITIDTTAPTAFARGNLRVISPNGDGNKDSVVITQEGSAEVRWFANILDSEGNVVRNYVWNETPAPEVSWDGIQEAVGRVPDGNYTYVLEATDKAGNRGQSEPVSFTIDTAETPVLLSVDYLAFSPNGDGRKDVMTFIPELQKREGITSYTLTISAKDGSISRSFTGGSSVPPKFIWDGQLDGGVYKDGFFEAILEIEYVNGNKPMAKSPEIEIDTVAPTASIALSDTVFSPNDDGRKDVINVRQSSSTEESWEVTIASADGKVVKTELFSGELENIQIAGLDENGNLLPNGTYTYHAEASDKAGNLLKTEKIAFNLDNRQTRVFATNSVNGFSPNGDGRVDSVSFNLYVNINDGIDKWSLNIIDQDEVVQKAFTGVAIDQQTILEWDGKTDNGKVLEGTYKAVFEVEYAKGDFTSAETSAFALDISAPAVAISHTPGLFSPDNDGNNDELIFSVDITDNSEIHAWQLVISDPKGNPFKVISGQGNPEQDIIWDGKGDSGRLVVSAEDYDYRIEAMDVYGNTNSGSGTVPVDILVIKDGDAYRVQVPGIIFQPNSDQMIFDDSPTGIQNKRVLDRVAEIFKKYTGYSIVIEGHAVNDSGTENEEKIYLLPISTKRAVAVKNALVERGLSADRIETIGIGGRRPIVPHTDLENRWVNRRVEFILKR